MKKILFILSILLLSSCASNNKIKNIPNNFEEAEAWFEEQHKEENILY